MLHAGEAETGPAPGRLGPGNRPREAGEAEEAPRAAATERPHSAAAIGELREIVDRVRVELQHRTSPAARALREQIDPGFRIDRTRTCRVYVIELDTTVRSDEAFSARNAGMREDRPCLYVGSTSKTIEERREEHRSGPRSSRIVKRFGREFRREFFERYPPMTREEAEAEERALAALLRREGYGVWQE